MYILKAFSKKGTLFKGGHYLRKYGILTYFSAWEDLSFLGQPKYTAYLEALQKAFWVLINAAESKL